MGRRSKYVTWPQLAAIAVLLLGIFAVLMAREQDKLAQLQAQHAAMESEVVLMEGNYAELAQQLDRVGTDGHVENAARQTFGYVKEGEIIFAFRYPEMLDGYTQEEYQYIIEEMR